MLFSIYTDLYGVSVSDTIQPDTIRTKTLTNYIILSDTLQTDTVITYRIFKDTTLIDTVVQVINYSGNRTKDTIFVKVKIIKPRYWKIGGNGSIQFSQGYLSHWVEGGESSISLLSTLGIFANYSKKKVVWENFLQIKNGQLKAGRKDFRKSEDKLEANTKFGHLAFNSFYYSIMCDFKSQLFKGFDYPDDIPEQVSEFMAPARIFLAIGIDYKPNDKFSLLISPLTAKFTYISDTFSIDPMKYGLEPGKKNKSELGAYVKMQYKLDLTKNIQYEIKFDLFSNYLVDPQNIDINWENYLVMKINKYISTNIATHLIYDHDVDIPLYNKNNEPLLNEDGNQIYSKRPQFKEMLSVGFSYKF
ncbi:MAG: DUF3078 domain-containing protein [Bacteroidota bacterium]